MGQLSTVWGMLAAVLAIASAFMAGAWWGARRTGHLAKAGNGDESRRLERRVKELTTLHAFATASAAADGVDALIEGMTRVVGESLSPHYFGILLVEGTALREHGSYSHDPAKRDIERIDVALGQGVVGTVAVSGEPVRDGDVVNHPAYLGFGSDTLSELAVPIRLGGEVVGVINVESTEQDAFAVEDERLLVTLSNQLAIAMEKLRLFEEVRHLASTDALTGLANRRQVLETAQGEFDRARRYRHPLSVLMVDVDHFKACNDTHGHAVGDEVLRELGRRGRALLRDSDSMGRYGGEEFLVVLPETGREGAALNAGRLCRAFRERAIETSAGALGITISIGIASFPEDGDEIESLMARADRALYAAKDSGRDTYRSHAADDDEAGAVGDDAGATRRQPSIGGAEG